jgi:hypothetical protein
MFAPGTPAPDSVHGRRPIIEVTGEGIVSAAPNRAVIVLGVVTENPNLTAAQTENAAAVANVIKALSGLNIPRNQIQTAEYRIEIQYNFENGTQTFRAYRVTHLLQITLEQVERTGLVVDTAVSNGANIVSGIRFTLANPQIYYNQALSQAVQNAELKANTIARTIGVTLARVPVKITEESRAAEPPLPYQASLMETSATTPIEPGELNIRAVVRAQYTHS